MTTTPNTIITNKEATAAQPRPPHLREHVSGADQTCVLDTVHLFPKVDTVDLNRHRTSCNPDIQNIANFRGTFASQDKTARVLVAEVADDVIGDIQGFVRIEPDGREGAI